MDKVFLQYFLIFNIFKGLSLKKNKLSIGWTQQKQKFNL